MKKLILVAVLFIYSCNWDFKEIQDYKFNIKYTIPLAFLDKDHEYFKFIMSNKDEKSLEKETGYILNFIKEKNIQDCYFHVNIKNGYPFKVGVKMDMVADDGSILHTVSISNIRQAYLGYNYKFKKSYDTLYVEKFDGKKFSAKRLKLNIKVSWDKSSVLSNINIDPDYFFKMGSKFDISLIRETK